MNALIPAGGAVGVKYADGQAGPYTSAAMRSVSMLGIELGCGGTHVEDVREIRGIVVKGVQKKKKNMRITYTVVD